MRASRPGGAPASYAVSRQERWIYNHGLRCRTAAAVAAIARHARRPMRVIVDVGTADGLMCRALAGPGTRVVGLERDGELLARGDRSRAWLVRGDALALPLRDGSVDGIVASAVLKHLARPADALSEAFRCVRTGGLVVVIEPTPAAVRLGLWLGHFRKASLRTVFGLGQGRKLLEAAGFEVVEASRFGIEGVVGRGRGRLLERGVRRVGLGALLPFQLLVGRKPAAGGPAAVGEGGR